MVPSSSAHGVDEGVVGALATARRNGLPSQSLGARGRLLRVEQAVESVT